MEGTQPKEPPHGVDLSNGVYANNPADTGTLHYLNTA
jgi:hypothetical protein